MPGAEGKPLNRPAGRREVYRRDGSGYVIDINLREARQLFNTLDPSPFHERDLDPAAEEYLVSAAREIGPGPSKLVIHLQAATTAGEDGVNLAAAVRNYFDYRAEHARQQLRLLFGRGLVTFAIGVVFLFACLSLRALCVALAPTAMAGIAAEGLLILGWVAMWRPVEIFLYEWWPLIGQRRIFRRLARMQVEIG